MLPIYINLFSPYLTGCVCSSGQREYIISYNGQSLTHEFSDLTNAVRIENETMPAGNASFVKALVIFLQTTSKEMEVFSVGLATVNIGCQAVTSSQAIAAGGVPENTYHDAEWIFFDTPAQADADMTIDIYHNLSRFIPFNEDSGTEWTMNFTVKALMGNRVLKPCSMNSIGDASYYFATNQGPPARCRFPFNWAAGENGQSLPCWAKIQPG